MKTRKAIEDSVAVTKEEERPQGKQTEMKFEKDNLLYKHL